MEPTASTIVQLAPGVFTHLYLLTHSRETAERLLPEVLQEIGRTAYEWQDGEAFDRWVETRTREIVAKHEIPSLISRELRTEFAEAAGAILRNARMRPAALQVAVKKLPGDEQTLLHRRYAQKETLFRLAESTGQSMASLVRELNRIHLSLLHAIDAAIPDGLPRGIPDEVDAGRMVFSLTHGILSADEALIYDSLALHDPNQIAFYLRYTAIVADLSWKHGGVPSLPAIEIATKSLTKSSTSTLSKNERWTTIAFVAALIATLIFAAVMVLKE
jgi:hypothetical protein